MAMRMKMFFIYFMLVMLMLTISFTMAGSCVSSSTSNTGCEDVGENCKNMGGECFQLLDSNCCCSKDLADCLSGQPLLGRFKKNEF
jgi:hypothetical protein